MEKNYHLFACLGDELICKTCLSSKELSILCTYCAKDSADPLINMLFIKLCSLYDIHGLKDE